MNRIAGAMALSTDIPGAGGGQTSQMPLLAPVDHNRPNQRSDD